MYSEWKIGAQYVILDTVRCFLYNQLLTIFFYNLSMSQCEYLNTVSIIPLL